MIKHLLVQNFVEDFYLIMEKENTKNMKTHDFLTQKWNFNIFMVFLEGIERIYYRKFFKSSFVAPFDFLILIITFDRLFNYEKYFILHRLLYFIRAVCLPTPAVCRMVGVDIKIRNTQRKIW